jgi:beta-lactamase class C
MTTLCGIAAAAEPATTDATVEQAAHSVMTQYAIPGMAIAITSAGRQQFYEFGMASKEADQAVTRDTLFEVGSVSKTLTATLAAYAQARGVLNLTDNPGRYLPALKGSALDDVSLINLATHTAGDFPLQLPDEVQTEQQLADYFASWRPQQAPGTYRSYANPSIGLLGRVTAAAFKQPYAEALQSQLLQPLNMTSTFITVPADEMKRYAQGYNSDGKPVRLNPALLADEAYGVKTSSKDLLRFVEAQLGTVKTDEAIRTAMMLTRTGHYRVGAMTQALIWEQYPYPAKLDDLRAGNSSKMVLESHPAEPISPPLEPQQAVWVNKTGSTNGFGAYVAFVPERQQGIVILANRYYPNEERVALAYKILSALD